MISVPDRRQAVELIGEARGGGARLGQACRMMGITVRTYQRWTASGTVQSDRRPESLRPAPRNKLSAEERARVLSLCHDPAYARLPPGQIVPRLADQGVYIACEASFYRILHEADEQHHRGRSQKPRVSTPPKGYCATAPNQVWSWDITYLPAWIRGMFFYLYMIVDVFSRKIVGWEVHLEENGFNAAVLVQKAILSEGCMLAPPVLHSDNGSPQKGFTLRAKLETLGVRASYSRPHVSDDNPYSEALFRTVKYRPDYPYQGSETLDDARVWVKRFVNWYNHDHQHSAIRYVTPAERHEYRDGKVLEMRRQVYEAAKARHPERWSNKTRSWDYIGEVWLNPPADAKTSSKSAKAA
jgi:transposase InsO family protein